MVVLEPAVEGLGEFLALGAHPADGQVRQRPRVALPGDQRLEHRPHRLGVQRGGDRRNLDQGPLQQLLQPGPLPGPVVHQVGAQPGVLPQPPDVIRWHEAGLEHAALGQLRQPHRVLLIGLGPPRHVLHRPGVDQLHRQARGLQHRVPDPPVLAGGLHGDDLDALAAQVIAQLGDRVHRRAHRPHVHHAPAGPVLIRHPGAHHPGRLRHVHRGDPLVNPLVLLVFHLLRLLHGSCLPYPRACRTAGCPGAPVGKQRLTGVLVATMRDPSGQGPGARLIDGMRRQVEAGFGDGQPAPSIHAPGTPGSQNTDISSQNPGHPPSRTPPGISRPPRRPPGHLRLIGRCAGTLRPGTAPRPPVIPGKLRVLIGPDSSVDRATAS